MSDIYMRILMSAQAGNTLPVISSIAQALGSGGLGNALGNLKFGFQNLSTEGTIGMDALKQGSTQLAGSFLKIGAIAAIVGGAVAIGLGVVAVKAAASYQQAMTQLQNTTNSSDADMRTYAATIRQLSDTTGKAQTDLAKGMYQIVSANFAGADAARILTTATQASVIAGADQSQVTTGLVVTLNAFGLKASQVDVVSNQMFKTLSLGRGNMSDLAGALQTGGALVAHYGVSVTDMDATLATLSTGGMKTFGTSMTGLTQLLNVMDGKTDMMAKRIQKLGLPFDEAKFKTMSFQQQVAYLNQTLENNKGQTVAILGSKQAATALGILGTQSALLAANTKKLADSHELAKEKQDAWAKVQGTFSQQMSVFGANLQNILIDLGTQLLPILTQAAKNIMPVVMAIGDWLIKSGALKSAINFLVGTITNLVSWGSAVVNFFKNNEVAMAALKATLIVLAVVVGVVMTVALYNMAVAGWIAMAPFLPLIAVIVGVIAVITGAILIVQHWGDIMDWLGNKAEQMRLKVEMEHSKMAVATDEKTILGAKKAIQNAETERQGILVKLKSCHNEKERQELLHQLKMTDMQIQHQRTRLQKAEEDKKEQLKKQKELHAQMEEAQKNFFLRWLDSMGGWISDQWGKLTGMVGGWLTSLGHLKDQGIAKIQEFGGAIGSIFSGAWAKITSIFGGIGNWFHDRWTQAYNAVTGVFGNIGGWFQTQYNKVTGIFGNIGGFFHDKFTAVVADIQNVFGQLGGIFTGIWNNIVSGIKGIINNFISMINGIINGINGISGKIGIPAIPDIPLLALGGIVQPGGLAIVGEKGPEIVAGGTGGLSVLGARQSAGILGPRQGAYGGAGAGGPTTNYYNTFNISTMARSQSEVANLVDMISHELANRIRIDTPGYSSSNIF